MPSLPRKRFVFLAAVAAGALWVLGPAGWQRLGAPPPRAVVAVPSPALEARQALAPGVEVMGQIAAGDLRAARERGFGTVIGLRPDGEEPGQPDAATLRRLAESAGLVFVHVPVPQGEMPDAVADALGAALASARGPVLLTCRSGRRAARAWALAEASRPGGMSPEAIQAATDAVGHSVADLAPRVARRAGARAPRG